jgi:prevent-host-death family protein
MDTWQLQEAKAKLTELINKSKHRPQVISRHGVNEAVLISMEQFMALTGKNQDIVSFFKNSPLYGVDLDLDRNRDASSIRDVDL